MGTPLFAGVARVCAITLLTGLCIPAHAADVPVAPAAADGPPPGWVGPPPGWSGGVLGGVFRMPDFEGSRSSRNQPLLGGQATYRSASLGSIEMGSRGLNWTVAQSPAASAGIGLSMDPGRIDNGDKKLTLVGLRPGSERLAGMGSIGIAPVLSVFGSVKLGPVPVSAALKRATGRQDGTQLDIGAALPWKIGPHAELSFGPAVTWADRNHMQAFFGVTPAQAAASHRTAFAPGAGWKSVQWVFDVDMALSRHWHVTAKLQAKRLLGDAADSPLTEKSTQVGGLLAALYQFQF